MSKLFAAAMFGLLAAAACAPPMPPSPLVVRVGDAPLSAAARESLETGVYAYGPADPDGIGKFHMGREISKVMGHLGAEWLERDSREAEERTDLLLDFLEGLGGEVLADIGAGTGYFALPWVERLSGARVLAVDIQPEMLEILMEAASARGLADVVEPVLGAIDDPMLPDASVDVVLIVDAYHEFSHPREMMDGIVRGLRPGGRLVLVEYRSEDPFSPIIPLHTMSEAQAVLEMTAAGLVWTATHDFLPMQHVMVFEKPAEGS